VLVLLVAGCGGDHTTAPPAQRTTTVAPAALARATVASATVRPAPLAGCPVPPQPPRPPGPPPWRPQVAVPETALPEPAPPGALSADRAAIEGKGMWVWQLPATERGDVGAIVRRARAAGLRQLWVRVGDSREGFYGGPVLDRLVPAAHRAGMAVVGWGFPYLYDPAADGAWTQQILGWRAPDGSTLDGFSADIETETEGTMLSARRVAVYLGLARRAAGSRLLVATVFRPTDRLWAFYPYATIAPYVDAFAAMVYWGCTEPGAAATQAIERLAPLRPVHLVGQAYDMGPEGGRSPAPSADETRRFLDVARRGGATGASFWVWQQMNAEEWDAMAGFDWAIALAPNRR